MKNSLYPDPHIELVERCKLGERSAQYQLYKLYSKAMFNVCLRVLNHTEEAEDVLQDAFVDAFGHLHQFRQQSTFGAWLKQIVLNKAISQLRSRKAQWVEIESLQNNHQEYNFEADSDDNGDEADLTLDRVKRALHLLPGGYRVVLSLYLFEGYDHEEISEVLGISESTSRTQYMRAKQKLIELIRNL
ncbi:RNA polymerase sigma factor [Ravibacter arvi]|uniref:RNA polymerase sigma factor n=1 Tax=Ravibacter arvi TaxID=2051041 RepID=A0ABP8M920_9BACT